MFTEILLFLVVLIMTKVVLLKRKSDTRRHPPSLPSLPLVGSLPFMLKFDNIHEFFMSKVDQLGPIFTFRAGSDLCLTLNSKETIEEALANNSACFAGRASYYIERITNKNRKGIAGKDFTDDFKRFHKLSLSVLKEFGFGSKRLMETRISEEFEATDTFIRAKHGNEFDPGEVTGLAMYNIIKNIIFGQRVEFKNGQDELLERFMLFMRSATFAIDLAPSLLEMIPYFKRRVKICSESMARVCEILEEEIARIKKNGSVECFVSSYLAKVGPDYDQEQLTYATRDLIIGGAETTTSALLWLLMFVANNPTVQERLQKEIDAVIPRHRLPSLDDEPKLPFVEATILEIMRIRTAVPIAIPHLTLGDSDVCGYFIPAGTKVFPNIHAAHMDPKSWENPYVFDPERFLDQDKNIVGKDRVISFSLGRRSCIGEILARQEIFLFFAGWMQRFSIQPGVAGQKIDNTPVVEATMKPRPFTIRMIPRGT